MIRLAICEDEVHARDALITRLKHSKLAGCSSYTCFEAGDALLESVRSGKRFDIVFLDVELPRKNGIEVGQALHAADPLCIILFISNYPQYAIDAFDCEAFRYLLKDCSDERFNSAIDKAIDKYKCSHRQLTVKTGGSVKTLNISDICYVECCGRHLYYHTNDERIEVRQTLKDAAAALLPFGFCNAHQGYLVNLGKIRSIEGNDAVLDSGEKVMISARRRSEVMKAYLDYLKRTV